MERETSDTHYKETYSANNLPGLAEDREHEKEMQPGQHRDFHL